MSRTAQGSQWLAARCNAHTLATNMLAVPIHATLVTLTIALVTSAAAVLNYQAELQQGPEGVKLQTTDVTYYIPAGQCSALLYLQNKDLCGEGVKPLGFSVVSEDETVAADMEVDAEWKAVTIRRRRVRGACPEAVAWLSVHVACAAQPRFPILMMMPAAPSAPRVVALSPAIDLRSTDDETEEDY